MCTTACVHCSARYVGMKFCAIASQGDRETHTEKEGGRESSLVPRSGARDGYGNETREREELLHAYALRMRAGYGA